LAGAAGAAGAEAIAADANTARVSAISDFIYYLFLLRLCYDKLKISIVSFYLDQVTTGNGSSN
jgi:hypothetical protein